jgi:hypothetical protein
MFCERLNNVGYIVFTPRDLVLKLINTTRKFTNTNRNINAIFPLVNYSEFYRRKYSPGIYQENYSGKRKN